MESGVLKPTSEEDLHDTDFTDSQAVQATVGMEGLTSDDMEELTQEAEGDEKKRRRRLLALLIFLLLLLLAFSSLFCRYLQQPAPLPEIILPSTVHYPPHYLFSIYGVDKPVGVTLSPEGDRLYVAETGGERTIRIFDTEGAPIAMFAPPRTRPGERSPVYLETDKDGRIFVTDRLQHAIYIFGSDGSYLDMLISPDLSLSSYVDDRVGGLLLGSTYVYNIFQDNVYYQPFGQEETTLPAPDKMIKWAPLGLHIDEENNLFVTDVTEGKNRVLEFALPDEPILVSWEGIQLLQSDFGKSGQNRGQFLFPNDVAADSQGRIYISDGNNGRISVWDKDKNFLFNFSGGTAEGALSLPRGIFIDYLDRLFVVDAVGQDVKVYDVSGEEPAFLYAFGDWGIDDGLFNYPNDIVVAKDGLLYIVDRENDRIQVWSY